MFASKSIAELDQIMCDAVGIEYNVYQQMTISEQFKIRTKYVRMKNRKQSKTK